MWIVAQWDTPKNGLRWMANEGGGGGWHDPFWFYGILGHDIFTFGYKLSYLLIV